MPFLNNNRLISKVSIWVVNLIILSILCVLIIQTSVVYKMLTPIEPIEDLSGVKTWSSSVVLNSYGYKLEKELHYSSEQDTPFETSVYLTVPGPMVRRMISNLENDDFKIRNRSDTKSKAFISDKPSPVKYKFIGQKKDTITGLYLVAYILSIALTAMWFWYLRTIVKNISQGKFFVKDNIKNFMVLSIPLLLLPFIQFLIESISYSRFVKNYQVMNGGLFRVVDFNIMPLVMGLIFLIMAGVIKEGMKIKEEQELTI